jgi:hypothetical protein
LTQVQKLYYFTLMPEAPSRIQYFHLRKPVPAKSLKLIAYQRDQVDTRGFKPFDEPVKKSAQITGKHIPGAILRIPGMHPFDTRWSCVDAEYVFNLPLRDDDAWSQEAMKSVDDKAVSTIKEIKHADHE